MASAFNGMIHKRRCVFESYCKLYKDVSTKPLTPHCCFSLEKTLLKNVKHSMHLKGDTSLQNFVGMMYTWTVSTEAAEHLRHMMTICFATTILAIVNTQDQLGKILLAGNMTLPEGGWKQRYFGARDVTVVQHRNGPHATSASLFL